MKKVFLAMAAMFMLMLSDKNSIALNQTREIPLHHNFNDNMTMTFNKHEFMLYYNYTKIPLSLYITANKSRLNISSLPLTTAGQLDIKESIYKDYEGIHFYFNMTNNIGLDSVGFNYPSGLKKKANILYNDDIMINFNDLVRNGYVLNITENRIEISNLSTGAISIDPFVTGSGSSFYSDGIGFSEWLNPSNAASSNNQYAATGGMTTTIYSENLIGTGFGFTIPADATIDGIIVGVERKCSFANGCKDYNVQLTKDGGTLEGSNRATATLWQTTDSIEEHGNTNDFWGLTWTPAEINSANFGAGFAAIGTTATGRTASVDWIYITIYYTTPVAAAAGTLLDVHTNIPNSIMQNTSRTFNIHVMNSSKVYNSGISCGLDIYKESGNGEQLYSTNSSVFNNYDLNITIPASISSQKGLYSYKAYCNGSSGAGIEEGRFYVTKGGDNPASNNVASFIYAMFIISIAGLLFMFMLSLLNLATFHQTLNNVLVSIAFFIMLLITIYLSENYLLNNFIEDISNFMTNAAAWTNVIIPVLSLLISSVYRSTTSRRLSI